jgi:hypothetical protein
MKHLYIELIMKINLSSIIKKLSGIIFILALIFNFSKKTLAVERTPIFKVSDIRSNQSFDPQGFNSGDSI